MDDIIRESEVAVDAEVEVGAEVGVGADSPFVHHADGRSDRLVYLIYTTCRLLGRQCLYKIMRSWILFLLLFTLAYMQFIIVTAIRASSYYSQNLGVEGIHSRLKLTPFSTACNCQKWSRARAPPPNLILKF